MPHYSVATTKDQLSSLIDRTLAGEEVVITRHGKPVVEMKVVGSGKQDKVAAMERLRAFRATLTKPKQPIPLHRFSEWLHGDEQD